ncbi:MAG TPA: FKBP-type peptidyl-prolyl cis-trans isomerase [Bacteroidales bacterium]|nr:FKBP-type peptidyl-prolyl cis-trans isomerase [Bacteroidales bacterium]
MKIKLFVVVTVVAALMFGSCGTGSVQGQKLKNKVDSLSYAFGIVNYNALVADSLNLNPMIVAKAMADGEEGKPVMSDEEARTFIMAFINEREKSRTTQRAEENKVNFKEYIEQNEKFLADNKSKAGVNTTASGLQYEVVKMGTGEKPTTESMVQVHYTGTLIDGTEFDSSVKRNQPAEFPVSGVITGWTEALQLMPVGSKFRLYIPQDLAYGENGAGDVIKPYSTLIFDVELLKILK